MELVAFCGLVFMILYACVGVWIVRRCPPEYERILITMMLVLAGMVGLLGVFVLPMMLMTVRGG